MRIIIVFSYIVSFCVCLCVTEHPNVLLYCLCYFKKSVYAPFQSTVLLMSVGRSVGRSVRPSVHQSVGWPNGFRSLLKKLFITEHSCRLVLVKTRTLFCKKCFPLIIFRTFYHRAIIFHMLIGLGENMTCIGFAFFKVKVTSVLFCKKHAFRSCSWELFITELSYVTCSLVLVWTWPLLMLDSLGLMSRSQGSLVKHVNMVFLLIILWTFCHRAFILHILIGFDSDMTP